MDARELIVNLTGASANARQLEDLLYGASDLTGLSKALSKFAGFLKKGKDVPEEAAGWLEELMRDLQQNSAFTPGSPEDTDKFSELLDRKTADFSKRMGLRAAQEQSFGETAEGKTLVDETSGTSKVKELTAAQKANLAASQKRYDEWARRVNTKKSFNDFLLDEGVDATTPEGVSQVNELTKMRLKVAGSGGAAGLTGRAGKPVKLDLTPSFKAKLSPLGVSSLEDLGELTAHGQLPQELVQALNAHATGDSTQLQEYLKATGTVPPEVEAAARTRKGLAQVPEQFAQLKEKLKAAESTIAETGLLAEKKKLKAIQHFLGRAETIEESGDPAAMKKFVDEAAKTKGLKNFFGNLPTAEGASRRLSDIQAEVADQNILGFGKSAQNTVEQNLARLRKATESVKSGAKGAAADLLEGPAKFGQNLPLVENLTKAAKGTKLSGDVAKSVTELKALLAEGESGVKAWMARKGGIGGVLKSPTAMALVLPLLFEAYQRMSTGASQARERAELDVQRESLPTVQNLLETYKAQRFAQQGVNNEAPDPRIVQALRRMGPQLTNSEVAIGPDRTIDNVLALRQQLMQE